MIQTGHWKREDRLDKDVLLQLLKEKFAIVDFEQAKQDVCPFVKDRRELDLWNRDFFLQIIDSFAVV